MKSRCLYRFSFVLCAALTFSGCETMPPNSGLPGDPDPTTNTNDNASDSVDPIEPANEIETPDEPDDAQIPLTSNSIQAKDAGPRTDPEGRAPTTNVTELTWKDSRGNDRTMTLGAYLYQYDFSFHDGIQTVERSANDDAWGHPGFGYVVSHTNASGNSPLGKSMGATKIETRVLPGGHHAIHRVETTYDRDREADGRGIKIPVVIEWLVATGRDHPIWSVTWKIGEATNPQNTDFNAYAMDVRGPYGSLNFDGAVSRNTGDAIGGVSWGDPGFLFTTTDAQLTLNSPWTYNTPNTVNFVRSWTANVNAEMAIIQTRPLDREMGYGDRVVGRERGTTSAAAFLNKGDCNGFSDARNYAMPCVNGWPYQMMNYDWDTGAGKPINEATGTKLLAWGSPYGWLGSSSFDLFDYSAKADGRGDRSYSTMIVLGPKNRFNPNTGLYDLDGDAVESVRMIEALSSATISNVTKGGVTQEVSRGPGATDKKTLAQGYNDTYAAHYLKADGNAASFVFNPAPGKPILNPVFVIENYTADTLPAIAVNGSPIINVNSGTKDAGAFVSVDTTGQNLWITLNITCVNATKIDINP